MSDHHDVEFKLGLDSSNFEKGLSKAGKDVKHFANEQVSTLKESLIEAFTVGAITEFAHSIIEFGAHIKDASLRLGVTTDRVQELSFAASQTGTNLDTVARGIEHIARAQEAVMKGGPEGLTMVGLFEKMGVGFKELIESSPDEIFTKLAEGLEKANVAGEMQVNLIKLMGRNAGPLIATMRELKEKSEEAHHAGLIISPEEIENLHKGEQSLDRLKLTLKTWGSHALNFLGTAAEGAGQSWVGSSEFAASGVMSKEKAAAMVKLNKLATDTNQSTKEQQVKDALSNLLPHGNFKNGSDSLSSVGNFLGSSGRSVIEAPVRSIDMNTRRIVDLLSKIAGGGGMEGGAGSNEGGGGEPTP